jgi:hypothetical protein
MGGELLLVLLPFLYALSSKQAHDLADRFIVHGV